MFLRFRESIIGSKSDFDLWALNGIIDWPISEEEKMDQKTLDNYIDSFEACHPNFRWTSCEKCQK